MTYKESAEHNLERSEGLVFASETQERLQRAIVYVLLALHEELERIDAILETIANRMPLT